MKKEPRYYQVEAYKAAIEHIAQGHRPYLSMSTGSGKSLVCAMLAEKALKQGVRALILVPTHELVNQNFAEHLDYTDNKNALGICSAKINKAQIHKQVVYATYTSFLRRRLKAGLFNMLILDECHYVNPDPDTSYQKIIRSLLRLNPSMKIIGLSATCYRQDQGMLHEDSLKGKAVFTKIAYETNIPDLIKQGYLSHVESISGEVQADMVNVPMKGLDYNTELAAVKFDAIVVDAVKDMRVKFTAYGITTAIIYASNLANARRIIAEWKDNSTIRLAFGDMSTNDRNALTYWLKEGEGFLRVVVNVGLFVTGFDYCKLGCVVLFVATKSLSKYVQIAGRVIRAHKEKDIGYILDYGGNIERHGPIDATIPPKNKKRRGDAPKKLCLVPGCGEINLLSAKRCKKCGADFISESEDGNYSMRTKEQALDLKREKKTVRHELCNIEWVKCYSKKTGQVMIKGRMSELDYAGIPSLVYEYYLCLEHNGFAGEQAKRNLLALFVNPKYFYSLGKTNITVDNILLLLNMHKAFFKKITAITLGPHKGGYKELVNIEFDR